VLRTVQNRDTILYSFTRVTHEGDLIPELPNA
jgi:hypothetical protein